MDKYDIQTKFEITMWSLPDTAEVFIQGSRYEPTTIPELTRDNLEYMIEKHNALVEFIAQKLGEEDE